MILSLLIFSECFPKRDEMITINFAGAWATL